MSKARIISKRIKQKSKVTKEEWREYTKTVWHIANTAHRDHPAVFPIEIPKRLIKLFSFYGETVLDPFAGVGTTAQAAIPLGRRAICVEQNGRYTRIMRGTCSGLQNGNGKPTPDTLQIIKGDSRKLDGIADSSVDLIVTSPPYWNKASYGGSSANVGRLGSYSSFLSQVRLVFGECFRVLRPGRKICIVTANVNQHTDHGLLTFPLSTDFAVTLRGLGFVMVNEVVWSKDGTGGRWGSWGVQRPIFGSYPYPPNFLFKNVHEYILIFAKPSERVTRGPKVVRYRDLMTERVPVRN